VVGTPVLVRLRVQVEAHDGHGRRFQGGQARQELIEAHTGSPTRASRRTGQTRAPAISGGSVECLLASSRLATSYFFGRRASTRFRFWRSDSRRLRVVTP
jgi:hypothetical protein